MTSTPPEIDPSAGVEGAIDTIVGGVNDNLATVAGVGGGLIAIGVVWRLLGKFVGRR